VIVDRYAAAASGWAGGAELVYRPIARELVALAPHTLAGRTVLDIGAGTGAASAALIDQGARPVAVDLSHHMLLWESTRRPPAAVGDVTRLPFHRDAVDDAVAAFIFNHLLDPAAGITEAMRVIRPGGALLACVYSNDSRSEVRDALDAAARSEGWLPPEWYLEVKQRTAPLLGTAENMRVVATGCGLRDVRVDERPVDVGVTSADQLVSYRLGQHLYTPWLRQFDPAGAVEIRSRLVEAIAPMMAPYRPIVVFLAARVPRA
jgi:SAM-dependent methyltransferase